MENDVLKREVNWTIKRVLPLVPRNRSAEKSDLEAILGEIQMCLHRNRKMNIDEIATKTDKVLSDMPNEYGQIPEDMKSWETFIGYLYAKYLKELGQLF